MSRKPSPIVRWEAKQGSGPNGPGLRIEVRDDETSALEYSQMMSCSQAEALGNYLLQQSKRARERYAAGERGVAPS